MKILFGDIDRCVHASEFNEIIRVIMVFKKKNSFHDVNKYSEPNADPSGRKAVERSGLLEGWEETDSV